MRLLILRAASFCPFGEQSTRLTLEFSVLLVELPRLPWGVLRNENGFDEAVQLVEQDI